MTYWPETRIKSANSGSVDAFARWRVSTPTTLFDAVNQYDNGDLFWSTALSGAGNVLHLMDESSCNLTVGGTLGDRVARQTYEYYRYEPGKSQLAIMSGTFGPATAGVCKRVGYFDNENGLFFEQTGAGMAVVVRSKTSGTPSDALRYPQASWNVDKLNGEGPSGLTLLPENSNIYWVDIEWLGVGRVRFGIWGPDGFPVVCHEERNANIRPSVYMTTAALPLRYEIENTAGGNAGALKQICSTVQSEGGGLSAKPFYFGSNNIANTSVTTRRAVFSIRPKLTFNGATNRVRIVPQDIGLIVTTNDALWELVYDPSFTGSPTWSPADTHSSVEFTTHTVGAGVLTGGIVVASGFAPAAQGSFAKFEAQKFDFKYPITLDINGANPKALSLVCTSLNNTANVKALMNWAEIR